MLLKNARIATMSDDRPYGMIERGAIKVAKGRIAWVGEEKTVPSEHRGGEERDLGGRLITPALIDCHTHIVYGGDRAKEFELRLKGATYEEISRAGGGIVSTVNATRDKTAKELLELSLPRVDALIAEGVSTIEVKSGYGLDIETECAMLRAGRLIESKRPIRVKTSFLGAHAVPSDYSGREDDFIDDVCIPALESAHAEGLADAVDGFCEKIAFTPEQIERVFRRARELGLPVKLHAEQLSNLGGAKLAARFGALSADHLEYAVDEDAEAMARAGTVAVLLPGAFYTLRESKHPPIGAFRRHGVGIAVATDCNPGSSPLNSILLALNMACTIFRLTPEESLAGATRNAARALGLEDSGRISQGLRADMVAWNVEHPAELAYRFGYNPIHERIFEGRFESC
ncbi:MAG: imidazolonepropionase [Albidovulum sp.]|nr:imidazolonepropionase [Albidovulum sp.]MDE0531637.1 imidazolonepropionase [Albidovulum sp.]